MKNLIFDQMVSFRLDGNWAGVGVVRENNGHSIEVELMTDCKEFCEGSMMIVDKSEIVEVPIYRVTTAKDTVYLVEAHIIKRGEGEQIKLIRGPYRPIKLPGAPTECAPFPRGCFDAKDVDAYTFELTDLKSI